jgi:NTP pyrophosphatase (non-canonical NTP hydrolase)
MTIAELQAQVKELRDAQGWSNESPERRAVFVVAKLGEVMQELQRLVDERGQLTPSQIENTKSALGMEIYDVFWNLCDLANLVGVDLETAFAKKVAINRSRRW